MTLIFHTGSRRVTLDRWLLAWIAANVADLVLTLYALSSGMGTEASHVTRFLFAYTGNIVTPVTKLLLAGVVVAGAPRHFLKPLTLGMAGIALWDLAVLSFSALA